MKPLPLYSSHLCIPQSSMFKIFSMDLAGPLLVTLRGNRFPLICVGQLLGWPIVAPTPRATVEDVKRFLEDRVIPSFGAPGMIESDNAACFKAQLLEEVMKSVRTQWRTVLAYVLVSNGRAKGMLKTIKHSIGRLVIDNKTEWDDALTNAVSGYSRRPMRCGLSQFELLYGVKSKLVRTELIKRVAAGSHEYRQVELLELLGHRAGRADRQQGSSGDKSSSK